MPEVGALAAGPAAASDPALVAALRAAGCVFAEEEAAILREAAADAAHLRELLAARVAGAPLEPLVGWVAFRGLRLSVGPGVFVPRQRSVLLADRAVAATRAAGEGAVMLEAFAGVAPIAACVRAEVPGAQVHAAEIDGTARGHARRNLADASRVHGGSVLDGVPEALRGRLAVIAAVAPYVPDAEAALLPREARDAEPMTALLGGVDGLEHIGALILRCGPWLAPGGHLLLEMHRRQMDRARALGEGAGLSARRTLRADESTGVLELARR
ncbi:hypothetical protein [Brachybacterium phenoliresistens]|uniref:SAM-dependent methyltransferase n=1 Tax=Brachybacterium phenoliresistens TaxID=396014 RepID=Z9JPQ3_9MICO|nr:hypothetical protein [Brachybacterium phenoliresistens]EWS79732.1 SAM-dependent methyltransferase [Brachybacterium phenoliresistens]